MFVRLALLLTVLPLLELTLLLWIAQHTSWQFALMMVLIPGLLGALLIRMAGTQCWREVRHEIRQGYVPAEQLVNGLFILVSGLLLLTPGVLTDLTGLALLIPPVRRLVRRWFFRRFTARLFGRSGTAEPKHDRIIDVRIIDPKDGKSPPQT